MIIYAASIVITAIAVILSRIVAVAIAIVGSRYGFFCIHKPRFTRVKDTSGLSDPGSAVVGRERIELSTTWRQCCYSCQAGILTRLDDRPQSARNFEIIEIKAL